MLFNQHSELAGKHAFLSASKYHWIRYTDEKLEETYKKQLAAQQGTILHDWAAQTITLGIKMARSKTTLNMYVNDAIGYRMTPEQVLYYSDNAFGTADAISFRKGVLRIHDLKTGSSPASMDQLMIYVALFCLEYEIKPGSIEIELRIYQNDEVVVHVPELDDILHIMDRIIAADRRIMELRMEAQL